MFGRLVYLSSLRDNNTGRYEHHGLTLVFGNEDSERALEKSHLQAFGEWLGFNLEQQKADLELYLSALMDNKRVILETWIRLAPYRNLIPTQSREIERSLFYADFETLLKLLKNEYGVSAADLDA